MFPCWMWDIVGKIFLFYQLLMLIYAVVSWVPSLRGRWFDYVAMAVEPVLAPVRRIIPPLGGIDISFIVVLVVLQLVARLVAGEPCTV